MEGVAIALNMSMKGENVRTVLLSISYMSVIWLVRNPPL